MYLSIDDDKDSSIKIWLSQNSDVTDIQKLKSQNDVITENGETVITSDAVASRSRGQPLKVVEKMVLSTERKGRRLNDRDDENQSCSKSRTFAPKRHLKANGEVPNRVSRRLD